MDNILKILAALAEVVGALAGVGVLCGGIKWVYLHFGTKKLCYSHKMYPISDEKYFHIISLWNPTYQVITENDITKPISFSTCKNEGDFHILNYTDKCLVKKIKVDENYRLQIDFAAFPAKAGMSFSYVSNFAGLYINGEVKNKSLDCIDYKRGKNLVFTPVAIYFLVIGGCWIFPKINSCVSGLVLCGYIVFVLIIYFLEHYLRYTRMPGPLWTSFSGENY
ncbi:hypothetical protein [Candidatus Avelusimicrobium faecicola]|uniref:hypothetical protein n=1 Tax=Candidatus Avelusimicrobium faecicola TaxID=3416205 RepID=UPI003D10C77C